MREIAKEIKERLSKADKQTEQARNHLIAVNQLLAEAKGLCDEEGFNKFREMFCPQLGRSQAYSLMAIATGKMTIAEHRAQERDRKRKTRANKKTAPANSGTVPENSKLRQQEVTPITGKDAPAVPEQPLEDANTTSAISPRDQLAFNFTSAFLELNRVTKNRDATRFVKAHVEADDLARVGSLLIDLAALKRSGAFSSSLGNNPVSPQLAAEQMKTRPEAGDAAAA